MTRDGFPRQGTDVDTVLATVRAERPDDLDWRGGRAFSLVYNTDDPELERLQHEVAASFLHENALNPFRYRSLLRMEGEILDMATDLLGASHAALTSGGTESIFLAVQTARDHARANGVQHPVLVCSETAHPAFAKACAYLDVERRALPVRADRRADPAAYEAAIDDRVALLVVSAPCYPFGVIDPIEEIAALAAARGLLCHVDACLGGYLLPFWAEIGRPVPPWDFRVPGVTSMSADLHKYGYSFKGVSTVLYRDRDLYRRQIFLGGNPAGCADRRGLGDADPPRARRLRPAGPAGLGGHLHLPRGRPLDRGPGGDLRPGHVGVRVRCRPRLGGIDRPGRRGRRHGRPGLEPRPPAGGPARHGVARARPRRGRVRGRPACRGGRSRRLAWRGARLRRGRGALSRFGPNRREPVASPP
jgi:hypothetical protein